MKKRMIIAIICLVLCVAAIVVLAVKLNNETKLKEDVTAQLNDATTRNDELQKNKITYEEALRELVNILTEGIIVKE